MAEPELLLSIVGSRLPPSCRVPPPIKRSAGRSSGGCCLAPFKSALAGHRAAKGQLFNQTVCLSCNELTARRRVFLGNARQDCLCNPNARSGGLIEVTAIHYLAVGGQYGSDHPTRQQLFRVLAPALIGLSVYLFIEYEDPPLVFTAHWDFLSVPGVHTKNRQGIAIITNLNG